MQNYKAPDNSLHFLSEQDITNSGESYLPPASVPITDEEAEALRPKSPEPTPLDLLEKLDSDNALTQRNLRETIMLMNEAFKQISNGTLDLSAIPGVARVYEVEAEAEEIRALL